MSTRVISRIRIRNYMGIEERDTRIPPAGAVARGKNGGGKTSVLRAVRAALEAEHVGPDAIRNGAEKAEILIDLDDVAVRRVITRSGSTLSVTVDGMRPKAPQTYLEKILGTAPLDPLDLYLAKPKDRRAKILAAIPLRVTVDQLRQWAPVDDDVDVGGHALEVLSAVRQDFYERRTEANRRAAEAAREAERLAKVADDLPSAPAGTASLHDVTLEHSRARAAIDLLDERARAAETARQRQADARSRLDANARRANALRGEAVAIACDEAPLRAVADAIEADVVRIKNELAVLRRRLDQRVVDHGDACNALDKAVAANDRAKALREQAQALDDAAAEGARALDAVADGVTEEERRAAIARVEAADAAFAGARARRAREDVAAEAKAAAVTADGKQAAAAELDRIVRALTNDAPAALLGESCPIPGLSLDGETILLDGIRIDDLSGAEQMRFAVSIAKRMGGPGRILVCDGLERLDPESLDDFVRTATEGGWQLLGTKVSGGDVVLEGIEFDAGGAG
jgi:DNA repair exonuclease SbcCD ATPase subunit